jgi:lipopolysaccharide transport system ATP-binding protein
LKPIIKVENVSKQYRLGTIGSGTLRRDFNQWLSKIRGKEDPYAKIGETNDRTQKGKSDLVWALKDINFEVMPGEILGIIGKNGAGKSTLLKILSKVTGPTTGSISYNGRIGSLLEVGTGFHPELTGRENIFLNGAILGMTKHEIRSKLDEIIDFSGCERYIDTPVKRYSSGMTVRLGFAVAAHLEPEILVVDEVLAVGDAEFQKKAIGKMQDVSRNDGRTVLFVSHNLASIQKLCKSAILLKNGMLTLQDKVEEVLSYYMNESSVRRLNDASIEPVNIGGVNITSILTLNEKEQISDVIISGSTAHFDIKCNVNEFVSENVIITLNITNRYDERIMHLSNYLVDKKIIFSDGLCHIRYSVEQFPLQRGQYSIGLFVDNQNGTYEAVDRLKSIVVENGDFYKTGKITTTSLVHAIHTMRIINESPVRKLILD